MEILNLHDVTYSYDKKKNILKGISIQMETGKMYAILGPSGCGKTTLLSLLGGLDSPSSGKILFEGESVGKNSKAKTVYMPTESYFYSYMTWKDAGHYFADFYEDFNVEKAYDMLSKLNINANDKLSLIHI